MKPRNRYRVLRVLALTAILWAAWHWGAPVYTRYVTPKKTEQFVPNAKVREGKFTVSFHQIGTLQAEKSVAVSTETGGKIVSLVPDGTYVNAGDILLELDTTEIERDLNERVLAYRSAQADVDRQKAELELLKASNQTDLEKAQAEHDYKQAELDRAKSQLKKLERLAAERLVPGTRVEDQEKEIREKELEVLLASKSLAIKKEEIKSKEQQKQADVQNKQFAAEIAKSNMEQWKRHLSLAKVAAPTSGMVVLSTTWTAGERRKWKTGDVPWPRATICELPDLSNMQVKVQVGEADAPRLELGIPVLIRPEAVKNKVFHGSVIDISRLVKEADPWDLSSTAARRSFEVTIDIKEVDKATLKPGMTADVEFICDNVPSAVYVPIEAVMERDGKTYVFVKNGKKYKLTQVKTGLANDTSVVVTTGLKRNEVIALRNPNEPIEPVEKHEQPKDKEPSPVAEAGKK